MKRVVVTGLGIIGSNGIGKRPFFEAVFNGVSGIRPVSLFDTQGVKSKTAGEITDFKPEEFLGPKGLRTLDRSTKLLMCAAKLALDDAGIEAPVQNGAGIGMSIGNTLGSLHSVCDFDRESIREGPRYVNPALFPNTVINSPASQVSIKFGIRDFNVTLSGGFCASIHAIKYAVDFLRLARATIVLAGGVEELCLETFLAFYKTGLLSGSRNEGPEISCPFDRRRNGFIFGEGAGVLVLEELESAQDRKSKIYGEVTGTGVGFGKRFGLRKAMTDALRNADKSSADIDYISCAANSTEGLDARESGSIRDVFGRDARKIRATSIKSMLGECFSAQGALQAVEALGAIERQRIPPTINYREKDPRCDLSYVTNESEECAVSNVLINTSGPAGESASLVLSKCAANESKR